MDLKALLLTFPEGMRLHVRLCPGNEDRLFRVIDYWRDDTGARPDPDEEETAIEIGARIERVEIG